jgi:hypothetical protein
LRRKGEAALPVIFKNPRLPDYFKIIRGIRTDAPVQEIPSIVHPYEHAQVLTFPNVRFDIDHDFWAALPSDGLPRLKKLSSSPAADDPAHDPLLDRRLRDAGASPALRQELKAQIVRLYEQVLPVYERLFDGYRFVRRQVVWRLNTIRNENLHIDTYTADHPEHFARLFINLDDQPRIWTTSYSIDELFERFGDRVPTEVLQSGTASQIRNAVNAAAFGGRTNVWWDQEPRHVVYFDPGETWAVDSRQVAHQIFYGRRAVSIDFFVDPRSMRKIKRHYLHRAEAFRRQALPLRQRPAAAE